MNKKILGWLLVFWIVFQMAWIAGIIRKENLVLIKGKEFRFRCVPFDPVHPFAGRYLQLNVENTCVYAGAHPDSSAEQVYLTLKKDSGSFAIPDRIYYRNEPESDDFLTLNYPGTVGNRLRQGDSCLFINYPFERYYLSEEDAPEAEKLVNAALRDSAVQVWVVVRVYRGKAVLRDVQIGDRSLKTWLGERE